MQDHRWEWGIAQWVEYLRAKECPVLPETRAAVAAMQAMTVAEKERLSALDIRALVYRDPYLALKILRRAEDRRSRQLGHDTTTPLAAILQTGYDEIVQIVGATPDLGTHAPGCRRCEHCSVLAGTVGRSWAEHRRDLSPDEIAMAALLADIGELLLWHYAPEMTEKENGIRDWNEQFWALNQRPSVMDFTFRQLTVGLAQAWGLPNLVIQLIRGVDTLRASLSRLASEIARQVIRAPEPARLAALLLQAAPMLPGVSPEALLVPLGLPGDVHSGTLDLLTRQ